MSDPTKNDKAWEKIFDKHKIINRVEINGLVEITANQIKEFREPRLMTKFDHQRNLPSLFKNNKLSILPITRGSYVIAKFNTYHKFETENDDIISVSFPEFIQSIDYENITSEATAINTAYVSGILKHFLDEESIVPTINGRMSSDTFEFKIKETLKDGYYNISVTNSQIEIDGGFEGIDSLALIEAKNSISDDFLIRQLYYPYRLWNSKINKPVRPIFLTYSNGIFTLNEYRFKEENVYNSLILVKQQKYSINPNEIELQDILNIYEGIILKSEPQNLPFPQANSFERVVNLCELLFEYSSLTKEEITYTYDFDVRQTDYYTNAAIYLGLIEKFISEEGIAFKLSLEGKKQFTLNFYQRNLEYVKLILSHKAFYLTFKETIRLSEVPPIDTIIRYMKESNLYRVNSDDTFSRRSSTIKGWINWILKLTR